MQRLCLLPVLAAIVALLSGCPDPKLPKPTPKVPQPKAAAPMLDGHAMTVPGTQIARAVLASLVKSS